LWRERGDVLRLSFHVLHTVLGQHLALEFEGLHVLGNLCLGRHQRPIPERGLDAPVL
jgi:hypothetical protein